MSLVRPGKLFRNCLTNERFLGNCLNFWLFLILEKVYMEPFNFTINIATCYHSGPNIFFFTVTISFCFLSLIVNNWLNLPNIICLICKTICKNIIQDWTSCVQFSQNFWKNKKFKKFSTLHNHFITEFLVYWNSLMVPVFGCPNKKVKIIFLSYKQLTPHHCNNHSESMYQVLPLKKVLLVKFKIHFLLI